MKLFGSLTGLSWLQTAVSVSDMRDLVSTVQAVPNSGPIIPRMLARLVVSFPVFVLSFSSLRNSAESLIYSAQDAVQKAGAPLSMLYTFFPSYTLSFVLFLSNPSSSTPQV